MNEEPRLVLHPDGTDTLYCRECETKFYDGEPAVLGDKCPDCAGAYDE